VPVSTQRRGNDAGDRDPLMVGKSSVQKGIRMGDE